MLKKVILLILVLIFSFNITQAADIEVDINQELGTFQKFWGSFGSGHISGTTVSTDGNSLFEAIRVVNNDTPGAFKLYRSPNMFGDFKCTDNTPCVCENQSCSSWHGVYREDSQGNVIYDWSEIDKIYKRIIDSGMKPVIELTFMPRQLLSPAECRESGCGDDWYLNENCIKDSCIGQWDRALMGPPKDWNKWKNLIRDTITHLVSEFGRSEVSGWYFEIWNEPNHSEFYLGDDLYADFYHYSALGAVEAMPEVKIGGPAVAGYHINNFHSWLDDVLDNNIRGEFYSYHQYNSDPERIVYGFSRFINDVDQIYSDHGLTYNFNKPILTSEYGPGTTGLQNNPWWRTSFPASWYVGVIHEFLDRFNSYNNNYNAIPHEIILWASIDSGSRGKGMTTTAMDPSGVGIGKRPLFNAVHATGKLGQKRISCQSTDADIKCFATKSDNSSAQVVVYRIAQPDGNGQLPNLADKRNITLAINNISSNGTYNTKYYIIDEYHSNCENPDSIYKDNLWTETAESSGNIFNKTIDRIRSNSVHIITIGDEQGNNANCSCSSWQSSSCGSGNCDSAQMHETRSCTPSGCSNETRCVFSNDCCQPPNGEVCNMAISYCLDILLNDDSGFCCRVGACTDRTADFDCNGIVELRDFGIMMSYWGDAWIIKDYNTSEFYAICNQTDIDGALAGGDKHRPDLNGDNAVDVSDFAILLGQWGK